MEDKYFDQILGSQNDKTTLEEIKLTKQILDAHIKEQPIDEQRENQRIGIKLQMKSYLQSDTKAIIQAGDFLSELFEVYNIKKSKFAEMIGYENANLHALLKGRRKFNSKLASIIGEIFKIEPETWLYIEVKNELKNYGSSNRLRTRKFDLHAMSHDR